MHYKKNHPNANHKHLCSLNAIIKCVLLFIFTKHIYFNMHKIKIMCAHSIIFYSSVVLRSQSFHSGVTGSNNINLSKNGANYNNRWTITSTESSDDDDDDYTINP